VCSESPLDAPYGVHLTSSTKTPFTCDAPTPRLPRPGVPSTGQSLHSLPARTRGATSSKSTPLAASHLAVLTRSARLPTLTTGPPFGAHLGHGVSFRRPRRAAATFRWSLRPDYRHVFTAGLPPARPPPVSERQPHAAGRLLPTERSTSTPTNTLRSGPSQRLATLTGMASHLAASHQQARRIATCSGWPRLLRASASRVTSGQGPCRLAAPRPPARRPHATQDLPQPATTSDTSRHRPLPPRPGTSHVERPCGTRPPSSRLERIGLAHRACTRLALGPLSEPSHERRLRPPHPRCLPASSPPAAFPLRQVAFPRRLLTAPSAADVPAHS
jgi:hypothetical protein